MADREVVDDVEKAVDGEQPAEKEMPSARADAVERELYGGALAGLDGMNACSQIER